MNGAPSAFIVAARFGRAEILHVLLKYNTVLFEENNIGNYPLFCASGAGHTRVVEMLLRLRDLSYPLDPVPIHAPFVMYAIQPGKEMFDTLDLLSSTMIREIQLSIDQSHPKEPRKLVIDSIVLYLNAIRSCIRMGYPVEALEAILRPLPKFPMVVALIRKEVTDPAASLDGESSLITVAGGYEPVFIKPLVHSGICSLEDRAEKTRKTALYVASEKGRTDCVEILLNLGASVSARSSSGRNALHAAIEHDNAEIVKLLCGHCSITDLTQKNNAGISPTALAENRGRTKIIRYILQAYRRLVTSDGTCKGLVDESLSALLERHANLLSKSRPY